jgi:predicted restriction endonuclease
VQARICPRHKVRYSIPGRCPLCPQDRHKHPTSQQHFRKAVLAAAGGRCQFIDPDTGERCPESTNLKACHLRRYIDGGSDDPSNGCCLCHTHHVLYDRTRH